MHHNPLKWGFKIYCLVDAKTNYLFDVIIEPGKIIKICILTNSEYNFSENILLIKLVNILKSKGFQVISTLRRNAKDFPDKNSIDKTSKKYA